MEDIESIYAEIRCILNNSRKRIYSHINTSMISAYWNIGRIIVEHEQKGSRKALYGDFLLINISERLTNEFGEGYNMTNLRFFRRFYLQFKIQHAVRAGLSWTHYRQLLRIENDDARSFYLIECAKNKWSYRELDRQINSLLYERLILSKDKDKVKELATIGQEIAEPKDIIKDPYVLEFLNLKDNYSESEMERDIINNLQKFLLELGKGFTFVARQQRITLDDEHFYIDLVFYNRILLCFVLIELKIGKLSHKDLGQLQMYVNYYDRQIKSKDENKTIGILLCSDKKDMIVKYTLPEDNKQIFASKYKLYLPTKEELRKLL